LRIVGKPLTIRAARASHPILVPSGAASATGAAFLTDSDLTLEGLQIEWSAGSATAAESEPGLRDNAAISSTGGVLRVSRCEIVVGRQSACVAISGAGGELRNSRLSSQSPCVYWRPTSGSRFVSENCIYTGRTAIACVAVAYGETSNRELPASLQLTRNTWQSQKGLQLVMGAAPRRPLEVRATRNRFGVEHLLTLYWAPRGPRSFQAPRIENVGEMLPRQIRWQEQENAYPLSLSFLSAQSPNQALKSIDGGPTDVAAWDAFWNRPDSGSRQGAAVSELRGAAGAEETAVGPGANAASNRTADK
jgi:hypothetical protein